MGALFSTLLSFYSSLFYDCRICFIAFHSTAIKMFPVLWKTMNLFSPTLKILLLLFDIFSLYSNSSWNTRREFYCLFCFQKRETAGETASSRLKKNLGYGYLGLFQNHIYTLSVSTKVFFFKKIKIIRKGAFEIKGKRSEAGWSYLQFEKVKEKGSGL